MAKKKKSSALYFAVGIFALLLVVNVVISMSRSKPKSFKESVEEKLSSRTDLEPRRKDQLRIQIAVHDWMSKNGGSPPPNLGTLIPDYFDRIPVDPNTQKQFSYQTTGNTFLVGKDGEPEPAAPPPDQGDGEGAEQTLPTDADVIALMSREKIEFVYDSTGKRDPFTPFNFAPQLELEGKTELEKYAIGQLRLTAVLKGLGEPKAIVENTAGKGFTIGVGTKIGQNDGEVVDIQTDKLIILEETVDFTGEKKTNTIELKLRLPGSGKKNTGRGSRR